MIRAEIRSSHGWGLHMMDEKSLCISLCVGLPLIESDSLNT